MSEAKDLGNGIQEGFRIPMNGATEALHVGEDDLPWLQSEDGSKVKVLHIDLKQGLWVLKTSWQPGYAVQTHYHHHHGRHEYHCQPPTSASSLLSHEGVSLSLFAITALHH